MISFGKFKELIKDEKAQVICNELNIKFSGSLVPLVTDVINSWDSTEFTKTFKRLKYVVVNMKLAKEGNSNDQRFENRV